MGVDLIVVLREGPRVFDIVSQTLAGAPIDQVAIGMLPRGEVGLVFAAIGRTLGVINDAIFSAIVLMVVVTTLIAPPLLKAAIGQQERRQARA